jgi:hypothetical protein
VGESVRHDPDFSDNRGKEASGIDHIKYIMSLPPGLEAPARNRDCQPHPEDQAPRRVRPFSVRTGDVATHSSRKRLPNCTAPDGFTITRSRAEFTP